MSSSPAFVPASASSLTTSTASLTLAKSSFTSPLSRRRPTAAAARRAAAPVAQLNDSASIDFSKVNVSSAGSNLEGLVFTPESASITDASPVVKTRIDVGYTSAQESALNAHINVEYTASYAYHAIWAYFNRDVVALPGFAKYFLDQSEEERDHAHEFMTYQGQRGGIVELQPVAVPEMKFTMTDGTSDALYAMDLHLQLEKFVYNKLIELHKVAEAENDPQMQDFVEGYLEHQLEAMKTAADYVSQIKRVGTPHGVYQIDLVLRGDK